MHFLIKQEIIDFTNSYSGSSWIQAEGRPHFEEDSSNVDNTYMVGYQVVHNIRLVTMSRTIIGWLDIIKHCCSWVGYIDCRLSILHSLCSSSESTAATYHHPFSIVYMCVCVGRYGLGRNRVAHGNSGTACSRVRSWGYNKIKRLASQHPEKHHSQQQPPVLSSALMPMRNDVDGAKVEEEEEVYTYVHMETHDIAI